MKKYTWQNIPLYILKSIRKKWDVKEWNESLWTFCDLCNFILLCRFCPAPKDKWCNYGNKVGSKLAAVSGFLINGEVSRLEFSVWQKNIKSFLKMIDKEIERRKKCQKHIE